MRHWEVEIKQVIHIHGDSLTIFDAIERACKHAVTPVRSVYRVEVVACEVLDDEEE